MHTSLLLHALALHPITALLLASWCTELCAHLHPLLFKLCVMAEGQITIFLP